MTVTCTLRLENVDYFIDKIRWAYGIKMTCKMRDMTECEQCGDWEGKSHRAAFKTNKQTDKEKGKLECYFNSSSQLNLSVF